MLTRSAWSQCASAGSAAFYVRRRRPGAPVASHFCVHESPLREAARSVDGQGQDGGGGRACRSCDRLGPGTYRHAMVARPCRRQGRCLAAAWAAFFRGRDHGRTVSFGDRGLGCDRLRTQHAGRGASRSVARAAEPGSVPGAYRFDTKRGIASNRSDSRAITAFASALASICVTAKPTGVKSLETATPFSHPIATPLTA